MRCPSSVRPSSVIVNFSHFRLLIWNRWMEFNETWQWARSQRPSLCFSGQSEKQGGRHSLWLAETFRLLHWNRWTEVNNNWQEAWSQHPLASLWFRTIGKKKQDGQPGLRLAEIFSTSPLKSLKGIQQNLTGSKISTSSTKFVVYGPIGKKKNKMAILASDWMRHYRLILWNRWTEFNEKLYRKQDLNVLYQVGVFRADRKKTRWPPWPLIGWDLVDFSSETAGQNLTKLDMKQDLNILYQVCVLGVDRKNKMATLFSGWLRHFRRPLKPL